MYWPAQFSLMWNAYLLAWIKINEGLKLVFGRLCEFLRNLSSFNKCYWTVFTIDISILNKNLSVMSTSKTQRQSTGTRIWVKSTKVYFRVILFRHIPFKSFTSTKKKRLLGWRNISKLLQKKHKVWSDNVEDCVKASTVRWHYYSLILTF
jgi:hypothetical protein